MSFPLELEVGVPHTFISGSAGRAPPSRIPSEPRNPKAESQRKRVPVASSDEADAEGMAFSPSLQVDLNLHSSQNWTVSKKRSSALLKTSLCLEVRVGGECAPARAQSLMSEPSIPN